MKTPPKQGDIWVASFDDAVGRELKGFHSFVVLQSNKLSKLRSDTIITAPLVKSGEANWPFMVSIAPSLLNHLDKERYLDLSQLRVTSVSRLKKKQGELEEEYLWHAADAIVAVFEGKLFDVE